MEEPSGQKFPAGHVMHADCAERGGISSHEQCTAFFQRPAAATDLALQGLVGTRRALPRSGLTTRAVVANGTLIATLSRQTARRGCHGLEDTVEARRAVATGGSLAGHIAVSAGIAVGAVAHHLVAGAGGVGACGKSHSVSHVNRPRPQILSLSIYLCALINTGEHTHQWDSPA